MKLLFIKISAVFIVIISCVIFWFWTEYNAFLVSPVNNQAAVKFTIKSGSTLNRIANQLYTDKIISFPKYFKLYTKLQGKAAQIQAGEYIIKPDYTIEALLKIFVKGEVTQYQLTIPEGWTLKQIFNYLQKTDLIPTITMLKQKQIIKLLDMGIDNVEGYIFPDTYYFPKGTKDIDFLKRSINKMQTTLTAEWHKRDKNLPLKSPYEALILASIVEKESGQKSERSKIAGVFIRRLRKGMRLQSDPTIIYGMGDAYKGNIRKKDINQKTAYNTYQINGLPPTPIASPGQNAIHAVLHPDSGRSLYFVADGSGGHYFSKNLKEHNQAVRKYILKKL
ncbi:MAG: endolytic transglycosylase MltG [Pseudomonadota bacterium]